MNISSDDTLAYPNVSRIQSPKRAYSWGHHRPDYQGKVHNKVSEERERDDTIVPASHGYITTGTPYHEAESNVLKRIYRLSQQTFNDFAANWNGDYRESRRRRYDRRSKIMDSSRLQRDLEDPDCNIEMHPVSTNSSLEDKKKLLALMSQCLVRSGCPSHRIESSLDQTARYLEVEAAFSYVPGQMTISFGNAITTSSHTVLIKVHQGHDMKKLAVVDDVANALCRSEIPVHDCLVELEEIHHSPPTWGSWATILAFTICSSTSCLVMFGGSWSDALVSALLGFLVGALNVLASHHSVYSNVFEVSASAAVAVISRSLFKWVCFSKVALSAVIVLLPGYSMTVAVMELSARQIAAGTIRFVYSVIYAFILGYGLQIGSSLYGTLNPVSDSTGLCEPGISEWYYVPLLPLLAISIAMTFGASVKQWPSMIVCCIIAFIIVFFLNKVITDYQIAASISAFAIGLYANLALKVTRTPPLVPLCCGITLLVPGGIGVRGAYHLLMDDDPDGSAFALNMVVVALGIAVGLFASTMIIYPRSKRRSIYVSM
ncbi:pheromone-regulated protein prm10 [Umbelopsis sp. WA50703]